MILSSIEYTQYTISFSSNPLNFRYSHTEPEPNGNVCMYQIKRNTHPLLMYVYPNIRNLFNRKIEGFKHFVYFLPLNNNLPWMSIICIWNSLLINMIDLRYLRQIFCYSDELRFPKCMDLLPNMFG